MSVGRWKIVMMAAAILAGTPALAVPISFTISGQVAAPGTLDAVALAALPQSTQAVTYRSGSSTVSDTFDGPTLWNVLQAAGGITTNLANKNDILRDYVVATGADGYTAVISAGEISPKFGNRQDLVATSDALNQLPSPSGFARVVATGDMAGGRYVSNLTSLSVRSASSQPGVGGGISSTVTVQGAVNATVSLTLALLEALTPYTQTVTFTSGTTSVTDTYTGALLWDVLGQAGIQTNPAVKNDVLRKLVTATGTDGYQSDFALGELSPSFGNEPILVAYSDTAGQIASGAGFTRLVVPGDLTGGRYVSNLHSLTVFDGVDVPEPSSLLLLIAGLASMGIVRYRKRALRRLAVLLFSVLFGAAGAHAEDGLRLFAAGSLTNAMTAMLAESGLPQDQLARPVFGPSGVLRERIEGGAPADVLASADRTQPRRLAAERGLAVIMFTRNSLCALATTELGVTPANLLDRMLDRGVKLGTSTPGADPGGDYAWAVFARAEALRPGAKTALETKALKLVGGPDSKPLVPGKGPVEGVFLSHAADVMLGYCSGAASIMRDVPGLISVPLPPELAVGPAYGMVVLTDHPLAIRFALFVMSEKGQAILASHGFRPVGIAD